ncbi:P-loop containing nucleoside triphosphate hydrolase protein [Coniella lustricola]|uniref:P-loop containing nucleoside triphosphate hydrolase protein n=1 Tax=Coniella lustricola TaxID=2025994 RepID=A0A2T3A4T2_9PEZI|nr:P-loop containing nucleoside triphosphate hydrolase protein [Coniella lustricola]
MLRTCIFEKSLRLSPGARLAHPPAQIINMSAVDVDFLATYVLKIHDVWVAPLQIVAIVILAASIIGSAAFVGFTLLLILFFGQSMASQITRGAMVKYLHLNDERLAPLRELLNNIKSVKATAYEDVFRSRLLRVRNEQLKALWVCLCMAYCLFTALNQSIPTFTAAAAFVAYYVTGHQLTAAVVFPALAYFQLLSQPVFFATLAVTRQAAILPAFKRVRALLSAEESEPIFQSSADGTEAAIKFEEASFTHPSYKDEQADSHKLDVGNLVISRNKLTAVVGPTGSGKSSLLQAMLGEMTLEHGSFQIFGSVAYVSQDSWIMSGTLRENIVFMADYDQARYQKIVSQCCLVEDFELFPGGDQFMVGESGSNLSGGQRARIALARALFSKPDILLLDDPLSAVDGTVRHKLFQTIRALEMTVVLVTLHTSLVQHVDNIIVFERNRVVAAGGDLLSDIGIRDAVVHEEWLHDPHVTDTNGKQGPLPPQKDDSNGAVDKISEDSTTEAYQLVETEERARGAVRAHIFGFYVSNAGGSIQMIGIALLTIALTASKVMGNYWFVWWIADRLNLGQDQYLGGYLGLTLAQCAFISLLSIALIYSSVWASQSIHTKIVDNLLDAPVSYFQRQSTGRILNRMSSDIESLDTSIINAVDAVLGCAAKLLASLCLIAVSAPIVAAVVVPYVAITTFYQLRFRVAAREVQRSVSILQSPVTAILSEALSATASIKAYGAVMFMVEKHGAALDRLLSAKTVRKSLDTWITLRAELAAVMLLLAVAILTATGHISDVRGGLALTFATGLANDVFLLTWGLTDLEVQMNSVERLQEYHDNLPKEGELRSLLVEHKAVPKDWPRTNSIDIRNMSLIYPSRPTPAIDNLTLHIQSGERVGIVGRTGCGKSTLVSSIARLVDPTIGSITIDGIETASIPPHRLRSAAVQTLPQEPLIYEGTVRENVDPEGNHSDAEILSVLQQCGLSSTLASDGLQESAEHTSLLTRRVATGGVDLSAGQRQLLCAARILLSRLSILLVDEAAANIDYETERALQGELRRSGGHDGSGSASKTTMVVIAHRAASLAWMDRIIVMEDGKVVEEGTPLDLLADRGATEEGHVGESYYRAAVRTEGEEALQAALAMAREQQQV